MVRLTNGTQEGTWNRQERPSKMKERVMRDADRVQHQFASKAIKKLVCQKSTDNLDAANDVAPKLGIIHAKNV